MYVFYSSSSNRTQQIAFYISKTFKEYNFLFFLLDGELGSGKTEFVKGVAKYLGFKSSQVKSPSFIIINELVNRNFKLIHIDLYRINKDPANRLIFDLLEELNLNRKTIICIEWASKLNFELLETLKNLNNSKILKVKIELLNTKRKISVEHL